MYDAPATVVANQAVQRGPLSALFTVDFWGSPLDADYSTRSYRPLVSLTFALQARSLGDRPAAFHLTDIGLHALASVLVVALASTLGIRRPWAAVAGALFALHPVQSEAVASVVGRADLMAVVCLLGAMVLHLRAPSRPRPAVWDAAALLLLGLALLCKEYAVAFPFVLIGTDLARGLGTERASRRRWPFWAGALLLLAGYLTLRLSLIGALGGVPMLAATDHPLVDAPWIVRWSTAARLIALAARLLVLPTSLNHHYRAGTIPVVETPWHPLSLAGVALLAGLLLLGVWWARRRLDPLPLIAWLLLFLPLLPALNLVSLGGVLFAERYLYVPMTGFVLLVAWALDRAVPRRVVPTRVALGVVAAVLLVAGGLTVARVEQWSSDERLARSSLAAYPRGSEVWRDLGLAVGGHGRHDEALAAFERSLELEPEAPQTWKAYATALVNLGRYDEGTRAWRRCIELTGDVGSLWLGLGQAELFAGEVSSARESLGRARALMPGNPDVAAWYGRALHEQALQLERAGRYGEAAGALAEILTLDPAHAPTLFNLGRVLLLDGRPAEAARVLRRGLELQADPRARALLQRAEASIEDTP